MKIPFFIKRNNKAKYFILTQEQFNKIYPELKMRVFYRKTDKGIELKTYSNYAKKLLKSLNIPSIIKKIEV